MCVCLDILEQGIDIYVCVSDNSITLKTANSEVSFRKVNNSFLCFARKLNLGPSAPLRIRDGRDPLSGVPC